ncbi:hypothetical protein E4U43_005692, partial [Claviceps pusilla]
SSKQHVVKSRRDQETSRQKGSRQEETLTCKSPYSPGARGLGFPLSTPYKCPPNTHPVNIVTS